MLDEKKIEEAHRRLIIRAYNYSHDDTPAGAARYLTDYAIRNGLTNPRRSIYGETLRTWARDGHPPMWAVIAAFSILSELGYHPREDEIEAFLRMRKILLMPKEKQ